jgi:Subtilase family
MTAPRDPHSNRFSNRIRDNARLSQDWPTDNHESPCVWVVNDQLLISEDLSPFGPAPSDEGSEFRELLARYKPQLVGTLYGERSRESEKAHEVHIVEVELPDEQSIFRLTLELRSVVRGRDRDVTPNHILIPAWLGDGCPFGPPQEWDGSVPPGNVQPGDSVPITLLDSGFCWEKEWAVQNPLDALGYAGPPTQGSYAAAGGWVQFPYEGLVTDPDGRLGALTGHANFVAGILAQRANPRISIWNHNASFVADVDSLTTEISVLHSLVESQRENPTPVIVVTYAFPAFEGVLSSAWDSVLYELRAIHAKEGFVIVSPAGNQGSYFRRYPAALGSVDPERAAFREVIGVGSLEPCAKEGSYFSNFGRREDPWVSCSAVGEGVVSTFLPVDIEPEDDPWPLGRPPGPHNFSVNGWAEWQGTCFAAPKVAAAIARETLANAGTHPRDVYDTYLVPGHDQDPIFGVLFTDL